MKENFRNLVKEIDMKVQEAPSQFMMGIQRSPLSDTSQLKCQRLKTRENLKSSKRKAVTYKEVPIRLSANFSKETLQGRAISKKYSKS